PKEVFLCEEQTDPTSQRSFIVEDAVEESLEESQEEFIDIYEEVSRVRQRVNRLNHVLGTNIPECPKKDLCKPEAILLFKPDEVHPDILQMIIDNNKLGHQMTQLQSVRKSADLAINMVRNAQCRNRKLGDQLQRRIQELDSFKLKSEKHQGLCLQRFRFLEKDKYCGREFDKYIHETAESIKNNNSKRVIMNDYEHTRKEAFKVIKYLKRASESLRDHLSDEISTKKQELFQNI
ncbi:hypothetical protein KR084_007321, partial [Drosophila pseudotakahashii]